MEVPDYDPPPPPQEQAPPPLFLGEVNADLDCSQWLSFGLWTYLLSLVDDQRDLQAIGCTCRLLYNVTSQMMAIEALEIKLQDGLGTDNQVSPWIKAKVKPTAAKQKAPLSKVLPARVRHMSQNTQRQKLKYNQIMWDELAEVAKTVKMKSVSCTSSATSTAPGQDAAAEDDSAMRSRGLTEQIMPENFVRKRRQPTGPSRTNGSVDKKQLRWTLINDVPMIEGSRRPRLFMKNVLKSFEEEERAVGDGGGVAAGDGPCDARSAPQRMNRYCASLDLRGLGLASLSSTHVSSMKKMMNLTEVTMSYNALTSLPSKFSELSSLRILNLSFNKFSRIPAEVLSCRALEVLDVSANAIQSVPTALSRLADLRFLNLSRNEISELPAKLASLHDLSHLHLHKNRFLTFPPVLLECEQLSHLLLDDNELHSVPSSITQLTNLRVLALDNNRLLSLPPLHSGIRLSVDGNQLLTQAEQRETLLPLTSLDMSGRSINLLPDDISQLVNLTRLDLSSNELTELPFVFKRLSNLISIQLSSNRFESIPLALGHLPLLAEVHFAGNSMKVLRIAPAPDENELSSLFPSLRYLDLKRNRILDVLVNVGKAFANLKELHLSHNVFRVLPRNFTLPPSLRLLDISNNVLTDITAVGLPQQLQGLMLENNCLPTIPFSLGLCENLSYLGLTGNPLDALPLPNGERDGEAVLRYLREAHTNTVPRRLKLMVLGDDRCGRHQVARCLRTPGKRSIRSRSFHPFKDSMEELTVRAWDPSSQVDPSPSPAASAREDAAAPDSPRRRQRPTTPGKGRSSSEGGEGRASTHATFSIWDVSENSTSGFEVHKFFMSTPAVFVLCFDMQRPLELRHVPTWLTSAQSYAPSSRVFIVGTHFESKHSQRALELSGAVERLFNTWFMLVQKTAAPIRLQWCEQSQVDGQRLIFWPVNVKNGSGVAALTQRIVECGEETIQQHSAKVPRIYEELGRAVRALSKKVVPMKTVIQLGRSTGLDEAGVRLALSLCRDWGSVLSFSDGAAASAALGEYVVVDPTFVHQLVQAVANKKRFGRSGIITKAEVVALLASLPVPEDAHPFVLELLVSRQVLLPLPEYRLPSASRQQRHGLAHAGQKRAAVQSGAQQTVIGGDAKEYLMPCVLARENPSTVTHNSYRPGSLARVYSFPFLPEDFFFRLLLRCFQFALAELIWTEGALLFLDDEFLLVTVEAKPDQNNIMRSVLRLSAFAVSQELPITMFRLAILALENLCNDWFGKLRERASVTVPCPHCIAHEREEPHMFDTGQCIEEYMEDGGITGFYCPKDDELLVAERIIPELRHPYAPMLIDSCIDEASPALTQGAKLGEGSYGVVRRGEIKAVGSPRIDVAVKQMRPFMVSLVTLVEFQNEVSVLRELHHPNVIKLYFASVRPPSIVTGFFPLGSIDKYLHSAAEVQLPLLLKLRCALDIANGLWFIHERPIPILHRDIKSGNVLLLDMDPSAPVCAALCDFGLATYFTGTESKGKNDNPRWAAVEVLQNKPYTQRSDIYSFSILLFEIMAERVPFDDDSFEFVVTQRVIRGDRPTLPSSLLPGLRRLIHSCWDEDPDKRPTWPIIIRELSTIMQHQQAEKEREDRAALERHRLAQSKRPVSWTVAMPGTKVDPGVERFTT